MHTGSGWGSGRRSQLLNTFRQLPFSRLMICDIGVFGVGGSLGHCVPVTNLKGLVTFPPSSSGSGISIAGMLAIVGTGKLRRGSWFY
jgi:hypothetical protein